MLTVYVFDALTRDGDNTPRLEALLLGAAALTIPSVANDDAIHATDAARGQDGACADRSGADRATGRAACDTRSARRRERTAGASLSLRDEAVGTRWRATP